MSDRCPGVVAAALVPGSPHLLAGDPAPSWKDLAAAVEQVGDRFRAAGVEALVLLSTQWFTVLGHQFQLDPNPQGRRTDENWYGYDFGHLDYDLRVDIGLTRAWLAAAEREGLQTRETRYDGFPIDTGTVVTARLLDPGRRMPLALVSCNLYAEVAALATLGATAVAAAAETGRRVGVVAVTGLSAGLLQQWISPGEDVISSQEHDRWNRRVLGLLTEGRLAEALALREQFAREALADSQFRALAFLAGTGAVDGPAELLSYGPVWGTGAAVLSWTPDLPAPRATGEQ